MEQSKKKKPFPFGRMFSTRVGRALHFAETVGDLEHAGLKGLFREALVEEVLLPLLPTPYKVGTGVVIDHTGEQSNQADVIIWDDSISPPLYQARGAGIYAIESVVSTIEIKSEIDADAVRQVFRNAIELATMSYLDWEGNPWRTKAPANILFGFDSTRDSDTELDRLLKFGREVIAAEADRIQKAGLRDVPEEFVQGVIIPEKTSYAFGSRPGGREDWIHLAHTATHGGLRDAFAAVLNSLRSISAARMSKEKGWPRLGRYLVSDEHVRAEEGPMPGADTTRLF